MATAVSKQSGNRTLDQNVPPNQSIYVQNLPIKIHKYHLKRALYMLFSTYGPVLDIVAMKSAKMRGQAHILFRDIASATQAMRHCQGFEFFGRELKISYAKSKSKTLIKLLGTTQERPPQAIKAASGQDQSQPPSSFPAPPGTVPAPAKGLPPPPGLASKAPGLQVPPPSAPQIAPASPGTKRRREESDEEEEGAPMEVDDDSGAEMDMSDDD